MSLEAMSAAWKLTLPCNEKVLLLALADWHRPDMPNPFPGHGTLATKTGLSGRTVTRLLRKLRVNRGLIRCFQRRRADGTRTSDAYELLFLHQHANLSGDNEGRGHTPTCHPIQKRIQKKAYQKKKEKKELVDGREEGLRSALDWFDGADLP